MQNRLIIAVSALKFINNTIYKIQYYYCNCMHAHSMKLIYQYNNIMPSAIIMNIIRKEALEASLEYYYQGELAHAWHYSSNITDNFFIIIQWWF